MLKQVIEKSWCNDNDNIRGRLKEGFIVKHITPFAKADIIEYILEKDITPICDYIKLHEATKEQLLEELSKRLEKVSDGNE
jgi:hypothetical protein